MLRTAALLLFAASVGAQPTLPSGTYTYDGAGNITAVGSNTYSYDPLGRLTRAVVISGGVTHVQEFTYDAYGNMTSTKTDGMFIGIGVDAATNRLTGVAADAYDEAGNLRIDGALRYEYDALGQMSEKVSEPQLHEYYVYDANDERIAVRAAPDNWHFTFRDLNGKPLREFRGSELNNWSQPWTWVQDWVWRDGRLLGSEHPPTDGGRQHYHLDHLGTPRLATTTNGLAVARHDYYPYGMEITPLRQEVAAGFSQEQAMKFTGHERDFTGGTAVENTNYLDYMHARSYSSTWGRFLSVDPTIESVDPGKPQSWNRYVYVRSSAITFTDPTGRKLKLTGNIDNLNALAGAINAELGDAATFIIGADGMATLTVNPAVKATASQQVLIGMLSDVIGDATTVAIAVVRDQPEFMGRSEPEAGGRMTLDIGDMVPAAGSCATTPGALAAHEIAEKWAMQAISSDYASAHVLGTFVENRIAPWQRPIGGEQIVPRVIENGHQYDGVRVPYFPRSTWHGGSAPAQWITFQLVDGKVVRVSP